MFMITHDHPDRQLSITETSIIKLISIFVKTDNSYFYELHEAFPKVSQLIIYDTVSVTRRLVPCESKNSYKGAHKNHIGAEDLCLVGSKNVYKGECFVLSRQTFIITRSTTLCYGSTSA